MQRDSQFAENVQWIVNVHFPLLLKYVEIERIEKQKFEIIKCILFSYSTENVDFCC